MREIQNIIAAANNAYQEFAATEQTQEVRVAVSNAVKFLVADLTSVDWVANNAPERWR